MNNEQPLEAEVVSAINDGKKITAIKILREKRGIGLKEAKGIVDEYVDLNTTGDRRVVKAKKTNGFILLGLIVIVLFFLFQCVDSQGL